MQSVFKLLKASDFRALNPLQILLGALTFLDNHYVRLSSLVVKTFVWSVLLNEIVLFVGRKWIRTQRPQLTMSVVSCCVVDLAILSHLRLMTLKLI